MVIHSEENANGIEVPAITIAPIHAGFVAGWKSPKYTKTFSMFDHCKGFYNMSVCVDNDTIEKEEFLNSAEINTLRRHDDNIFIIFKVV